MRAFVIVAALATWARAQPTIELRPLANQPIPDELGQQLRIYLADTAAVEVGPPLAATTLPDRVREVAGSTAELVTWLEQVPGPAGGGYIVVVVGKRDGRAVVDIGQVPPSDASGRLLALRIGAFLDDTLASGVGEKALGAGPQPPPTRWLALALGAGRGELPAASVGVEVGARRGPWVVEAGLVGSASLPQTSGDMPSLELAEQRLGVVARAGRVIGPVDVGLALELDGERAHVVGVSAAGTRSEATSVHAVVRGTGEVAWWVTRQVAVRGAVGVEHATSVERFLVEGEALATIGTLAFVATAGIAIRFP